MISKSRLARAAHDPQMETCQPVSVQFTSCLNPLPHSHRQHQHSPSRKQRCLNTEHQQHRHHHHLRQKHCHWQFVSTIILTKSTKIVIIITNASFIVFVQFTSCLNQEAQPSIISIINIINIKAKSQRQKHCQANSPPVYILCTTIIVIIKVTASASTSTLSNLPPVWTQAHLTSSSQTTAIFWGKFLSMWR